MTSWLWLPRRSISSPSLAIRCGAESRSHDLWVDPLLAVPACSFAHPEVDLIAVAGDQSGDSSDDLERLRVLRTLRVLRLGKLARLLRASRMLRRWLVRLPINYGSLTLAKTVVQVRGVCGDRCATE